MFGSILKKLNSKKVSEPPYEYDFLINLQEAEYPIYLKKIFKYNTGRNLNLKNPKTFNEKIQWLKLYDVTLLKSRLTDKILVRDWIKNKIGEYYLKPVLWIGKSFDDIPFEILPEKFYIKANHGCKWHYKIKNKESFLSNEILKNYVKMRLNGWLEQSFFPYAGFELQYKNISPKILVEPVLINSENESLLEYEIYCFNGKPKISQQIRYTQPRSCCVRDEKLNIIDLLFSSEYRRTDYPVTANLKTAIKLSKKLAKEFKLVRVDWLEHDGRLYFNEMTFTPFSGFYKFEKDIWNKKLGKMLNLSK